jgi:hypothetical protein
MIVTEPRHTEVNPTGCRHRRLFETGIDANPGVKKQMSIVVRNAVEEVIFHFCHGRQHGKGNLPILKAS